MAQIDTFFFRKNKYHNEIKCNNLIKILCIMNTKWYIVVQTFRYFKKLQNLIFTNSSNILFDCYYHNTTVLWFKEIISYNIDY
jgi:hypothetical protein